MHFSSRSVRDRGPFNHGRHCVAGTGHQLRLPCKGYLSTRVFILLPARFRRGLWLVCHRIRGLKFRPSFDTRYRVNAAIFERKGWLLEVGSVF